MNKKLRETIKMLEIREGRRKEYVKKELARLKNGERHSNKDSEGNIMKEGFATKLCRDILAESEETQEQRDAKVLKLIMRDHLKAKEFEKNIKMLSDKIK